MSLRDQMRIDIQRVFFNPLEFAELHSWQNDPKDERTSRKIPMIFESFDFSGRPVVMVEGVVVNNAVVHIPHEHLAYTPSDGDIVKVDGQQYEVTGVFNEFGVLKISLIANRTF